MKPKEMLITNRLSMPTYSSTCVSRTILDSLKRLNFKELRPKQGEALWSFLQRKDVFVSISMTFPIIAFLLVMRIQQESRDCYFRPSQIQAGQRD